MPKPATTTNQPPPRSQTIRIRLSKAEQSAINRAADLAGITTSSWCRMMLRKAAAAELAAVGKEHGL